ncbi:MAG: hypothetical protein FJY75_08890, partial [Candidatus Eisenbacteria bacterium]|nr:hypothetical protein [Candidatus Eisenbacteria bacterium]
MSHKGLRRRFPRASCAWVFVLGLASGVACDARRPGVLLAAQTPAVASPAAAGGGLLGMGAWPPLAGLTVGALLGGAAVCALPLIRRSRRRVTGHVVPPSASAPTPAQAQPPVAPASVAPAPSPDPDAEASATIRAALTQLTAFGHGEPGAALARAATLLQGATEALLAEPEWRTQALESCAELRLLHAPLVRSILGARKAMIRQGIAAEPIIAGFERIAGDCAALVGRLERGESPAAAWVTGLGRAIHDLDLRMADARTR